MITMAIPEKATIEDLRRQIAELKTANLLTTKEPLIKLWDNEYDEQWNKC